MVRVTFLDVHNHEARTVEDVAYLIFGCPCGQHTVTNVVPPHVDRYGISRPWDGNFDAPTITGSFGCENQCGCHFKLEEGLFK